METSYNNRLRFHSQVNPQEDSNLISAICTQLTQLNNCLTDYQISNNKKLESINLKVDLQLREINTKIDLLSEDIRGLAQNIPIPADDRYKNNRNHDKVLEIFNKHINKLNSDIQELSSSLYSGKEANRLPESRREEPLSYRGSVQRGEENEKSTNDMLHTTTGQIPIDQNMANKGRMWVKASSLKSPMPFHISAPSSPTVNKFNFDFPGPINTLNDRTTTTYASHGMTRDLGPGVELDNTELIRANESRKNEKSSTNIENTRGNIPYTYSQPIMTSRNGFLGTKEVTSTSSSSKNILENPPQNVIENRIVDQSEYNNIAGEGHCNPIEVEVNNPGSFSRVLNTSAENNKVWKPQTKASDPLDRLTNIIKNNIPGAILIKNKKPSATPQYRLEKSLKNVSEIWQEYEYGINGKPSLKHLEAKYSTKWRNETELRTYLRRKKIYDAIEKGKEIGYTEEQIIEELEVSRTFEKFGVMKKKPLLWLYSNIPDKFS